jgi:hypothetical protein
VQAKELLVQRLKFPGPLAAAITLPPFSTKMDPATVQAVIDAALSVGILTKQMQAEEVLAPGLN